MAKWMKRRIEKSRARCDRADVEKKDEKRNLASSESSDSNGRRSHSKDVRGSHSHN